MRWKLVLTASLLATLIGVCGSLVIAYTLLGTGGRVAAPGFAVRDYTAAATLLLPLAAVTFASIFVYRHTSRRRPLQAMITALLALTLLLAAYFVAAVVRPGNRPPTEPPLPPANNRV
jgi:hypothetical protein